VFALDYAAGLPIARTPASAANGAHILDMLTRTEFVVRPQPATRTGMEIFEAVKSTMRTLKSLPAGAAGDDRRLVVFLHTHGMYVVRNRDSRRLPRRQRRETLLPERPACVVL